MADTSASLVRPSEYIVGPSEYLVGPSEYLVGPSEYLVGPSEGYRGCACRSPGGTAMLHRGESQLQNAPREYPGARK